MKALVTGADRSTVAGLERGMVADGYLTLTRGKTGARIAIPLALRLDCLGWVKHVRPRMSLTCLPLAEGCRCAAPDRSPCRSPRRPG